MSQRTVIPIKVARVAGSGGACGASSGDPADPAARLQQQGWILRTTIGEPRLSEVVENYLAMGYEVHVERFQVGEGGCTTCFDAADKSDQRQVWGTVYVRQGPARDRGDELFD